MSLLSHTLTGLTKEPAALAGNSFALNLLALCPRLQNAVAKCHESHNEDQMREKASADIKTILTGIALKPSSKPVIPPDDLEDYQDLRLKRVSIKGIRQYPADKEGLYTLSFANDKDQSCSAIFLGINGIGKSSFYCAIEKCAMGFSETAVHRGYGNEQTYFLKHLQCDEEEMEILLDTAIGTTVDHTAAVTRPMAFPAYFCMERDIEILSKNLSDFYIARQIAAADYLLVIKTLREMLEDFDLHSERYAQYNQYADVMMTQAEFVDRIANLQGAERTRFYSDVELALKTLNNVNILPNDKLQICGVYLDRIREILDTLLHSSTPEGQQFRQKVLEMMPVNPSFIYRNEGLPSPSKELEVQQYLLRFTSIFDWLFKFFNVALEKRTPSSPVEPISNASASLRKEVDKIHRSMHSLQKTSRLLTSSPRTIEEMRKVLEILTGEYRKVIDILIANGNRVAADMFEGFFENDLREVRLQATSTSIPSIRVIVKAALRDDDGEVTVAMTSEPRHFLNTFRFKLFCVALKTTLAFSCSKLHNMNFPLVMDDVFDSSDFSNRSKIKEFIAHLFATHRKIFAPDNPLQLIFFTQDDVIGEAVYRGIKRYSPEEGVKYSRIFSLRELESSDQSHHPSGKKLYSIEDLIYSTF